jgi:hypothetical protein
MRFNKYDKQNHNFYKLGSTVMSYGPLRKCIKKKSVKKNFNALYEMKYVITSFSSLIFDPNFNIFNIMCTFLPLNG